MVVLTLSLRQVSPNQTVKGFYEMWCPFNIPKWYARLFTSCNLKKIVDCIKFLFLSLIYPKHLIE